MKEYLVKTCGFIYMCQIFLTLFSLGAWAFSVLFASAGTISCLFFNENYFNVVDIGCVALIDSGAGYVMMSLSANFIYYFFKEQNENKL